jgi:hypothetical protein
VLCSVDVPAECSEGLGDRVLGVGLNQLKLADLDWLSLELVAVGFLTLSICLVVHRTMYQVPQFLS